MILYVDYSQLAGDDELVAELPEAPIEVDELVLTTDGDASMYGRVTHVDTVVRLAPIRSTWADDGRPASEPEPNSRLPLGSASIPPSGER